jgi:KDO2-lipid IV(A) lauroyltransferase
MRVGLRHRAEYALARAALALAALVPERIAYAFAGALGRLYFRCAPRRQRAALRLLRNAYPGRPEPELRRLARISTGNLFKVGVDMVRVTRHLRRGTLLGCVDSDPPPAPLLAGPCLGLTGHLGTWEIAALSLAALRGRAAVVVRVFRNPLLQRWLERTRRLGGLQLLPRRGGIRRLIREVLAGGIGLQAVDQNQRLRGMFVPFFGEPASTERAAATLAVRKRVPIVVGACLRRGNRFRFRLRLETIPLPPRTGDPDADVRACIAAINSRLERLILDDPEQYLWIHDRYRTQPPAAHPPHEATAG